METVDGPTKPRVSAPGVGGIPCEGVRAEARFLPAEALQLHRDVEAILGNADPVDVLGDPGGEFVGGEGGGGCEERTFDIGFLELALRGEEPPVHHLGHGHDFRALGGEREACGVEAPEEGHIDFVGGGEFDPLRVDGNAGEDRVAGGVEEAWDAVLEIGPDVFVEGAEFPVLALDSHAQVVVARDGIVVGHGGEDFHECLEFLGGVEVVGLHSHRPIVVAVLMNFKHEMCDNSQIARAAAE